MRTRIAVGCANVPPMFRFAVRSMLVLLVTSSVAHGAPGMTLPSGRVLSALTFETNMSKDSELAPSSVAPDISVGVNDAVTLSIIHSGSALTGFRGGAGAGVCVTGPDDGCARKYAGGGLEAVFSHLRGTFALASTVALIESSAPWRSDLKLGLKLRAGGRAYVLSAPSVWVALDRRNDEVTPHEDQLFVPIGLWFKATPSLSGAVGTGLKGPLGDLGQRFAIPLGVVAQYALDPQWTVGASLVFGKVIGGDGVANTGFAARAVQVWVTLASG